MTIFDWVHHYFAADIGVRSIAISVSVYPLSVWRSVCMSVRSHISKTTCPNFHEVFCTCSHNSVLFWQQCNSLSYVLPVWCMTSCFNVMEPMGQNQRQHYVSSSSPGGGTGAKLLSVNTGLLCLVSMHVVVCVLHQRKNHNVGQGNVNILQHL